MRNEIIHCPKCEQSLIRVGTIGGVISPTASSAATGFCPPIRVFHLDSGVCLNELAIAIGVKGGNIQTILIGHA
jgi:hypothetical protein